MKKILSILFSILTLTVIAQVPQGVGYQGVATDANGIELVNQSISIRASVLSGSASGTIEWEETHATSTDTFGLFTITIGQGTITGNGVQADFADISWGTNTYFLKIEMDITGGTNYAFMGTNQMMSVPYALYAESANINYDSISNFLSGDSTFITNVGSGMGGDGCDFIFPEGLDGDALMLSLANTYTVPSGKRLYILKEIAGPIGVDGMMFSALNQGFPLAANSGQVISGSSTTRINALLINEKQNIQFITSTLSNSATYTPPSGKILYLTHVNGPNVAIDGISFGQPNGLPNVINSNNNIGVSNSSGSIVFNGYLVDENYFAGCGGGGSSLSSTLTNTSNFSYTNQSGETYVQNISQGDLFYLDGTLSFGQSNYFVVPSGKNLHIDYSDGSCETMEFYRNNILFDRLNIISKLEDLILTEGDSIVFGWITDPNCSSNSTVNYLMYGYLVDTDTLIQPLLVDITNNSYSVTLGKKLFVKETFGNFNAGFVTFPNGNISNTAYNWIQEIDFLESGTIIEVDPTSLCTPCIGYSYISGYLINE